MTILFIIFIIISNFGKKQHWDRVAPVKHTELVMKVEKLNLADNEGRRVGDERRLFHYTTYLPERRAGSERRSGLDRRKTPRRNDSFEKNV